jgi:endonuclease/exonuclease/phosphatase (EEP) superfamily protein YafD
MAAFLFWNLARKPLQESLASLATRHKVDVLMLAESALTDKAVLAALNADRPGKFAAIPFVAFDRVKVYSRFAPNCFGVPYEADQYAIRALQIPRGIEILLTVVHLSSPTWKKPADLHSRAIELANAIRIVEHEAKHDRTVVVGDFNMNPFHDGMLDVRGLNALGDRKTVERKSPRTFGQMAPAAYRIFYNPMWSHFGDANPPSGTYYYDQTNPEVDPLWNIFDQVLIAKGLLARFRNRSLRILTTDGERTLVTDDGRPDLEKASDHLPLLFRLDLRRSERP